MLLSVALAFAAPARAVEPAGLSPDEQAWLAAHPRIRVSVNADYHPTEFLDERGVHRGIAADYLLLVQERLGLELEPVVLSPEARANNDPAQKGADVVLLFADTPERRRFWHFTAPYLEFPLYLIARADDRRDFHWTTLAGRRVAVVAEYAAREFLEASHTNLVVMPVADTRTGLRAVAFGDADAMLTDLPSATWWLEREGLSNLRVAGETEFYYRMGMAVRHDWPELYPILQRGLSLITPPEREAIYRRWIRMPPDVTRSTRRMLRVVLGAAVLVLAGLVAALAWNATLRRRIRDATEELRVQVAELKRLETALLASENRFRKAFHASPDAIVITRLRDARILEINEGFEKIFGHARAETVGRTGFEIGIWKDVATREALGRALLTGQRLRDVPQDFVRRDGTIVQGLLSAEAVELEGEMCAVGTMRDVTERKQAEAAIRLSAERWQITFDAISDAVCLLDRQFRIQQCNQAMARLLGKSPAEIVGQHCWQVMHGGHHPIGGCPTAAMLASRHRETLELEMLGRWYVVTTDPIFDPQGGISGAVHTLVDVTERKRVEAELERHRHHLEDLVRERTRALAESEGRFRALVGLAPTLIVQLDHDGRIFEFNAECERALGRTRAEALEQNFIDAFVVPEDRLSMRMALREISVGETLRGFESRLRDARGAVRSFAWYCERLHDGASQAASLVAVGLDVTERVEVEARLREAKERAEEADHLKSAFLATMSHELRTPLNSIIGFTGILLQELPGALNAEQRKQLGMVQVSARHLLSLINEVLDLSKIEAGQIEIERRPFAVADAVRKVEQMVAPFAARKGLRLGVVLPPEAGGMVSDRRRFEQVLLNLANNAVKFTERGEVEIICETPSDQVIVHVRDTGMGIKPEDMDKLFQPFSQVQTGLDRRHEGTGLGLAICRRLASLLGGKVAVASRWNEGSVFTVCLPRNPGP